VPKRARDRRTTPLDALARTLDKVTGDGTCVASILPARRPLDALRAPLRPLRGPGRRDRAPAPRVGGRPRGLGPGPPRDAQGAAGSSRAGRAGGLLKARSYIRDGLLITPHYPVACELHDGPAVPSPTGHCEHFEIDCDCSDENCDLRHFGECCHCHAHNEPAPATTSGNAEPEAWR
jgi:hypothetical protein